MKRPRSSPLSPLKTSPPLVPSTPPPSHQHHQYLQTQTQSKPNPTRKPLSKTKRNLNPSFTSSSTSSSSSWEPLHIKPSELSLALTFPTGQTFTWKQTGPTQFTGPINSHLFSLKHTDTDTDIAYFIHSTPDRLRAVAALHSYLNLSIPLSELWTGFSSADQRFAQLAPRLAGARVLRQDPLECLFQFLCSSNNNIARITQMVGVLSSFGRFLGTVEGSDFYEFPSLDRLSTVSEQELREAGFGYRAKYIVGTVKALQAKPGGGAKWLASLRGLELHEVIDTLCTLPGVGPKVAACIALFSLDQHSAIPVDTHVWQIATRYLVPELAGARLTPKLHSRVATAFIDRFGSYAGWAQNVLFIGELHSQKALLPPHLCSLKKTKSAHGELEQHEIAIEVMSGN